MIYRNLCSGVPRFAAFIWWWFPWRSETTAFVNMASAKLKKNSVTRDVVLDSSQVLNTLAEQDLTLNKLRSLMCIFFVLSGKQT